MKMTVAVGVGVIVGVLVGVALGTNGVEVGKAAWVWRAASAAVIATAVSTAPGIWVGTVKGLMGAQASSNTLRSNKLNIRSPRLAIYPPLLFYPAQANFFYFTTSNFTLESSAKRL
jgi:hypothetical protein